MKKRIVGIILVCAMLIGIPSPMFAQNNRLDKKLSDAFNSKKMVDVLIAVKDSKKPTQIVNLSSTKKQQGSQRAKLVASLKANTQSSQEDAINLLKAEKEKGNVKSFESYYIVNGIRAIITKDVANKLLKLDSVESIDINEKLDIKTKANVSTQTGASWNIKAVKADAAWDKVGKGDGVVIGFIDSGIDMRHTDLMDQFRGYNKDSNTVTAKGNWLDLVGDSKEPIDTFGHGTATAGVAVGKNVGIAPEAKWIAVRAFSSEYTMNSQIFKAGEWMLAPGGDPSKAPDIINNSWGGQVGNDRWFDKMLNVWLQAGIFPVFASGNSDVQAQSGSIENPASLMDAFSVGAVDKSNRIAGFSKRGPSPFDPTKTIIKPELVAPGVDIPTTKPGQKYETWSGTSIATPNVSGVIALIKSANKKLTSQQIRSILLETATPLKDNNVNYSPNMVYGRGLINAEKAVDKALKGASLVSPVRIAGENRNETSEKIAQSFYGSDVDTLYIVNGTKFSDGLAMASMTKGESGPLILTNGKKLGEQSKAEIKRLSPRRIIVVGGLSSVSSTLETELRNIGTGEVIRIGGTNRSHTSKLIAERVNKKSEIKSIFLVNGDKDADAISIAATSGMQGIPVLMTSGTKLSPEVTGYIGSKGISEVTIIGGTTTVSSSIEKSLKDKGISVVRISGSDRYETASKINEKYFPNATSIFFANGTNIADALSVAPAAAKEHAAIQIVEQYKVPVKAEIYARKIKPNKVNVLGGYSSVGFSNESNIIGLYDR